MIGDIEDHSPVAALSSHYVGQENCGILHGWYMHVR